MLFKNNFLVSSFRGFSFFNRGSFKGGKFVKSGCKVHGILVNDISGFLLFFLLFNWKFSLCIKILLTFYNVTNLYNWCKRIDDGRRVGTVIVYSSFTQMFTS